jgi:hypothetical protein
LQTTWTEHGIVSGRVALLLRSAEIQPAFDRFSDWTPPRLQSPPTHTSPRGQPATGRVPPYRSQRPTAQRGARPRPRLGTRSHSAALHSRHRRSGCRPAGLPASRARRRTAPRDSQEAVAVPLDPLLRPPLASRRARPQHDPLQGGPPPPPRRPPRPAPGNRRARAAPARPAVPGARPYPARARARRPPAARPPRPRRDRGRARMPAALRCAPTRRVRARASARARFRRCAALRLPRPGACRPGASREAAPRHSARVRASLAACDAIGGDTGWKPLREPTEPQKPRRPPSRRRATARIPGASATAVGVSPSEDQAEFGRPRCCPRVQHSGRPVRKGGRRSGRRGR